ncbi:MAG: ATP-binding cassette domain-containing protein [Gammaproteobacteria bacterium]|nr:ATP-binding cassette domain-containing protein [Gammaproteobacteria bacterium]
MSATDSTAVNESPYDFLDEPGPNPSWTERIRAIGSGRFAAVANRSDLAACLPAFLVLSGWTGTARQLLEALGPDEERFDLTSLQNALVSVGFVTKARRNVRLTDLGQEDFPCVWLRHKRQAVVLCESDDDGVLAYDPQSGDSYRVDSGRGTAVVISARLDVEEEYAASEPASWLAQAFRPLHRYLLAAFLLTLMSSLLALATPLGIMAIYDRVIGTGSTQTLYYVVLGIGMALVLDLCVRRLRSSVLDTCSARIGYVISRALFSRLLSLPLHFTESTPVSAQLIRLRDLERVRTLVNGPLLVSCMDLPYTLIFLGVIWALGGAMVFVPLVAFVVYGILGIWLARRVRARGAKAASAARGLAAVGLEVVEKMRALRVSGAEQQWFARYHALSLRNARLGFDAAVLSTTLPNLSQTVASVAGLATMAFGVQGVLNGTLTTGGLIASMILVWKVLAPMQGLFVAAGRLSQSINSMKQIDGIMRMKTEGNHRVVRSDLVSHGEVEFDRVTFRYGTSDPELSGVSFKADAGDIVAIAGRNGAGKSTVIKLISGLYHAQSGAVRLDGRDIRQYEPRIVRHSIAVMPQTPHLVDGIIAENLRYAEPNAAEHDLWNALDEAGVKAEVEALPLGLETPIDARRPRDISDTVMTRLALARALLPKAPILLLDEPTIGLDFEAEFAFVETLQRLRGRCTVFLITHRPSYLQLCDKVLLLERGAVRYFGPADDVVGKIPLEML